MGTTFRFLFLFLFEWATSVEHPAIEIRERFTLFLDITPVYNNKGDEVIRGDAPAHRTE